MLNRSDRYSVDQRFRLRRRRNDRCYRLRLAPSGPAVLPAGWACSRFPKIVRYPTVRPDFSEQPW